MLWVFEIVRVCMYFPASIITFMCDVTFSNASFEFSEVKPSLIVLGKENDHESQRDSANNPSFITLAATADNS